MPRRAVGTWMLAERWGQSGVGRALVVPRRARGRQHVSAAQSDNDRDHRVGREKVTIRRRPQVPLRCIPWLSVGMSRVSTGTGLGYEDTLSGKETSQNHGCNRAGGGGAKATDPMKRWHWSVGRDVPANEPHNWHQNREKYQNVGKAVKRINPIPSNP
ncbi:hypothetical protein LF1_55210 [Rubripirellula obstinata]|uniref:Uncharacterized protein n=1 Tax=Rubripirellula obstinata TaxID=406547 RepID=A0A5B1CA73_9BACT|nr:hypothetical protein LF1_55210 [Rubripirellula obstinata]